MARRLQPIGTLSYTLAMLSPWRPAFAVQAPHSRKTFYVSPRDVVGRHIAKYGAHEPQLTRWIAAHLASQPRGIVIDVGANIGWHTVHAAAHPNVERVVSFEPDAFNNWLLDRNLEANDLGNVVVLAAAAGDKPGTAQLHRYKPSNNGRHSLLGAQGARSRNVPVMTLDDALVHLELADKPISLIKIDVEGYEPYVVIGALRSLPRTAAVITEFSPQLSALGERSVWTMVEDLRGAGFTPMALNGQAALTVLAQADLQAIKDQLDIIWLRDS